jgi:hypothetical protein
MNDQFTDRLLQLLERIAQALETLARAGAPAEPNYVKPLADYRGFAWESIGASVVQEDADGPTHVEWGGALWTRRSPANKFDPAIWFSRAAGKDSEGNVNYLRLITFKPVKEAEALPGKVAAATAKKDTGPLTPESAGQPQRPYLPEYLKSRLLKRAESYANLKCSPEQRGLAAMMLEKCFACEGASEKRHTVQMYLFGAESHPSIILVILNDWLRPKRDTGGDYQVDALAMKEAQGVYRAALVAEGQQELPL